MAGDEAGKLSYYEKLVHRLFEGTISSEEREELEVWYRAEQRGDVEIGGTLYENEDELRERLLLMTKQKVGIPDSDKRKPRIWYRVAAAIIAISLCAAGYLVVRNNWEKDFVAASGDEPATQTLSDILPGDNKAVLTLADGSQIVLDEANKGQLVNEEDGAIIRLDDDRLRYDTKQINREKVLFNTITTPAGGNYQIELSDGTVVWLNAKSSLRFPTSFAGNERKVSLRGEGYFEVVSNPSQPFLVEVGDMEVRVTGTHFNVKAYPEENEFQTTLLQGKVAVNKGTKEVILNPGQQAGLDFKNDVLKKRDDVNLSMVMAWKKDEFVFDDTELKEAMKILSRWYDFEVEYPETLQPVFLYGSVSRDKPLSSVLKMMKELGIRFRIEKRDGVNTVVVF